ncbi:MAG: NAD-dependent epimerase/dehydratase family protein [Bacteroidota bacterium]
MVFVTGGTGLVGSHLMLGLLQRGMKVRALKRKGSNIGRVLETFRWYSSEADYFFSKIEWAEVDMEDIFSLGELLEGIDEVYHCAAIVSFDRKSKDLIIGQNVESTANLVDAALKNKVKKFCHVSSVSALGKNSGGEPVNEETNWIPSKKLSGYSKSKFFSETEIWRGVEEGLDVVVVNPSIIIGPGNWASGSPSFFRIIDKGMKFYTGGATGFVDVRDVTEAMIMLMEDANFAKLKNQRYLLNSENLSYRDFFTRVANSLEKPAPFIYASGILLKLAAGGSELLSLITGKPAQINRDTLQSASSVIFYDGSKITRNSGFTYRPVQEAIEHTAGIFRLSGMKDK